MESTTDQTQAFPPTESERLEVVRNFLVDEVDKREKAIYSAQSKHAESTDMLNRVEHAIRMLQKMETGGVQSVADVAAAIVNSGQLDTKGLKVTATVGKTP